MVSIDVTRLRPSRAGLVGVVAVVWLASSTAVRELVWSDLRDGVIRTTGLPRSGRALVRAGLVLVLAMVLVMLGADVLRGNGELLVASGDGLVGRGTQVPAVLVPLTLFMTTVAWAFLLTGAVRAHVGVRVLVALVYVGTTALWLFPLHGSAQWWWAAGGLLAVPVLLAVPGVVDRARRRRGREVRALPGRDFAVALLLVGGVYALVQQALLDTYRSTGASFFLTAVGSTVVGMAILVTPLLVMIGLDVADFAYRVAGLAVEVAHLRRARVVVPLAAAVVMGWHVWAGVRAVAAAFGDEGPWGGPPGAGVAGALAVPLLAVGAVVGLRALARVGERRRAGSGGPAPAPDGLGLAPGEPGDAGRADLGRTDAGRPDDAGLDDAGRAQASRPDSGRPDAGRPDVAGLDDAGLDDADELMDRAPGLGLRLSVGVFGWQLGLFALLTAVVAVAAVVGVGGVEVLAPALALVGTLTGGMSTWVLVALGLLVVLAIVLAARGRRVVPLYLGVVGATGLWRAATEDGGALAWLGWEGEGLVTAGWVVVALAVVGRRAAAGRASVRDAVALLLVGVVALLAGGAEAVTDPFSPFFASAGLGLIAFGLVWDTVTAGSWANVSSPGLPSLSRLLLYLGYVLLSVTLITWAVVTHDLSQLDYFTGGAADLGFTTFGLPLLHTVFALVLLGPVRRGSAGARDWTA